MIMRRVLLIWTSFASSSQWSAFALRESTDDESSSDQSRSNLYHAGHGAVHVTRLHRYDHSGLHIFRQREEQWKTWHEKQVHGTPELAGSSSLLQLSDVQYAALQAHQQSIIQTDSRTDKRAGIFNASRAPTADELPALRKFAVAHMGSQQRRAVTGLSSLMSQYVGPIGVGSTLGPSGCLMDGGGEATASLAQENTTTVTCQVSEQANLWVVFDTGSTNIWISSDLCQDEPCAAEGRQRFDHSKSVSFSYPEPTSTLSVQFGTGKLTGPQARDDLHIGPFAVHNQTFAMIQQQEGRVFAEVPFEGILGLAFPSMSANQVTPFFDTVIQQKALEKNEFSIYFNRDVPQANAIFWGGVDKRFYNGEIEFFPVSDPYYWSMDLHSFKIGDECLFGSGCQSGGSQVPSGFLQRDGSAGGSHTEMKEISRHRRNGEAQAIVDSGTTFFTAEGTLFDQIMEKIPAAPCDAITDESHKNMTFTLKNARGESRDFTFSKEMYMTGNGAECSPAFMRIDIPKEHGPGMVFGEVFLRNYYTVFDRGDGSDKEARMGFAPAVHSTDTASNLRQLTNAQPSFQESRATALAHLQG